MVVNLYDLLQRKYRLKMPNDNGVLDRMELSELYAAIECIHCHKLFDVEDVEMLFDLSFCSVDCLDAYIETPAYKEYIPGYNEVPR